MYFAFYELILRPVKQCFYLLTPEAAIQRCSYEKVFWKYAANLQENTHAEMRFQQSYKATNLD